MTDEEKGQMTIFYSGKVNVYNEVPAEKLAASPLQFPPEAPVDGTGNSSIIRENIQDLRLHCDTLGVDGLKLLHNGTCLQGRQDHGRGTCACSNTWSMQMTYYSLYDETIHLISSCLWPLPLVQKCIELWNSGWLGSRL
uniref:Tify domain-containing protein n=1 Tax=Tanacetum cinerariifolium TaxID=118510 RepID=A0A6L2NEJ2_TANCI|nr:hypothetical protein [Tanacetum cinerariifolium]